MSSKVNRLQEFRFSGMAGERKKVDEFPPIIPQREDDNRRPESKFDLRKSFAWDSAFFTSPGILDSEELFETLNVRNLENGVDKPEHREQKCLPSESLDPERTSTVGECNPRRSLAWDSAFFTSAGFLDPEELSMVNRGFKKSEAPMLPGIVEEFKRSADSNSTIDTDYSLVSLEIDLFDDMKASVHKSRQASRISFSSSELGRGTGTQNFHSLRKVDCSSRTRIEPVPASRRQSVKKYGKEMMAKEEEVAILPRSQGPARNRESNSSSSSKPSKTLHKQAEPLSSSAIKRAYVGANTEKMEHKIRKDSFGQDISKRPCCGDSGSGVPLTPSPGSASSKGSDGSLSKSMNKSLSNSLRKKNRSRVAAYDSSSSTPSRALIGSRSKLEFYSQPVHSLSTSKSSSTSPSSSINGWSMGSSTSMNQISDDSKASLDATLHRGVSLDTDASQGSDNGSHSCNRSSAESKDKEMKLTNQHVDRFSKEAGSQYPTVSGNLKPSGLRMPLPKIGFFDMEKSMALVPNCNLKFHAGLQSSSKLRSSMSNLPRTSNRGKCSKFELPRASMRAGRVKLSLKTGASSFDLDIRPICPTDVEVKTDSLPSDSKEEDERKQGLRGNKSGKECRGETCQMVKKQDLKQNEDASTFCLEINPHTVHGNNKEKENICNFANEVDNLSRGIEAIDFSRDL
ncbi:hypothetical protein SLE2022_069170 [Rubroshorea leprosula]